MKKQTSKKAQNPPLNKGDVSGVGRVFERWLVVIN